MASGLCLASGEADLRVLLRNRPLWDVVVIALSIGGLIISGGADRVAPVADVTSLADKLKQQKGITITQSVVEGATHFFDPGMDQLVGTVDDYVRRRLTESTR